MSAGGPKGLAIAAKHADYMTYCLGPNADMIGVVRRELDKAVADAGRAPGSVKLVALSWFYQLRPGRDLGSRGRRGLRLRPDQLLHHQRGLHERARR